MTNTRWTTNGHEINPADVRRRQIRVMQLIFAGAATVATLALFSAAQPSGAAPVAAAASVRLVAAPSGAGAGGFATDGFGDGGVNDNGQTSGDIFTQNAQDQSTA
jgi:hypothetical protein